MVVTIPAIVIAAVITIIIGTTIIVIVVIICSVVIPLATNIMLVVVVITWEEYLSIYTRYEMFWRYWKYDLNKMATLGDIESRISKDG